MSDLPIFRSFCVVASEIKQTAALAKLTLRFVLIHELLFEVRLLLYRSTVQRKVPYEDSGAICHRLWLRPAMATVEQWQSAVETHLFKNHPHKMLEEIVRLCVILC